MINFIKYEQMKLFIEKCDKDWHYKANYLLLYTRVKNELKKFQGEQLELFTRTELNVDRRFLE